MERHEDTMELFNQNFFIILKDLDKPIVFNHGLLMNNSEKKNFSMKNTLNY